MKCIVDNVDNILEALQTYANSAPADSAAKARGFVHIIGQGNFILSVKCAIAVLDLLENLNRAVQSTKQSTASMIKAMKITVGALHELRSDDKFHAILEETIKLCEESDIPVPELPRQRRPARRFSGSTPGH